jgi:two-component system LytT family response regulator
MPMLEPTLPITPLPPIMQSPSDSEPLAEPTVSLRVLAADDELVARKRLVRLLSAMPGVELLDCHADAEAVLRALRDQPVDVLVLDIQMPGLTGLELHALLPEPAPYVIFATAHPEHAVQAFELGAVDYVLKPIEAGRLGKAIERARGVVRTRRGARAPEVGEGEVVLPRLPVSTREGVVLLDPATLSHAVFDGVLVTLVTRDGRQHLTDASLQEIAARLPADRFVRAHRRALLNLHEVALLRPTDSGGYLAITHAGQEVPVSRQTARKLRRALGL